jgi:hypothetical protein
MSKADPMDIPIATSKGLLTGWNVPTSIDPEIDDSKINDSKKAARSSADPTPIPPQNPSILSTSTSDQNRPKVDVICSDLLAELFPGGGAAVWKATAIFELKVYLCFFYRRYSHVSDNFRDSTTYSYEVRPLS